MARPCAGDEKKFVTVPARIVAMPPESRREVIRATKMSPLLRTAMWRARPAASVTRVAQKPSGTLIEASQPPAVVGRAFLQEAAATSSVAATRSRAWCMVPLAEATNAPREVIPSEARELHVQIPRFARDDSARARDDG